MICDFQGLLPSIVYIYYWEEKREAALFFKAQKEVVFQLFP